MSVIGMVDTTERPPFARFERRGVEDRKESEIQGRYIERDVDMALVTPPGSRDVFVTTVEDWFKDLARQVKEGRMPAAWYDNYKQGYKRWCEGEEVPPNGTPIKGWGVISPAQQKNLINLSILTVEDLAALGDEGLRRIGMGANDLKSKASTWLKQLQDKGGLIQENDLLKKQLEELRLQVEALVNNRVAAHTVAVDEDEELRNQYIAKFGKPPHHMAKRETILKQLAE